MKLAILFGGASYEHEISIVSAITVKEKLNNFDLEFIFCDQDHRFYRIDDKDMVAKIFASGRHKKMPQLVLEIGAFVHKKMFGSERLDMPVLNLIHGADGEDGTIASLLDFYSIDYIGPRPAASVFSYDKMHTKWFANAIGVKTVAYESMNVNDPRVISTQLPFIIKPARLGSSIGVSVIEEESQIEYALDVAFEFDENIIIEPFIEGVKEYNLAGYSANGGIHFSIVEEPQKNEFLDFDKKYLDFSRSSAVSEAQIDSELVLELEKTFAKVYANMFEGALIRCDFFVVDGEVLLNEINPIPGSMANYLFADFKHVINVLLANLPQKRRPQVNYQYIHSINQAKGK
ncbi:MAG: D-alanine--D-alanine ligase [Helicobacteraceae bacterium]|nr:D-alanine--D-alanine ligase [Helicobacteraceae bacterium]